MKNKGCGKEDGLELVLLAVREVHSKCWTPYLFAIKQINVEKSYQQLGSWASAIICGKHVPSQRQKISKSNSIQT